MRIQAMGVLVLGLLLLPAHSSATDGAMVENTEGASSLRAVPQKIPFQGFLQDAAGDPLPGPVNIEARLYDMAAGGVLRWGPENHVGVPVNEGVFSVQLGRFVLLPLAIFGPTDLWLEIRVNGGTPLPRTQFLAAPFAMRAGVADVADVAIADDGDWTVSGSDVIRMPGYVGIGTTTPIHKLSVIDSVSSGLMHAVGQVVSAGEMLEFRATNLDGANDMFELEVEPTETSIFQYIECSKGEALIEFAVDAGGDVRAAGEITAEDGFTSLNGLDVAAGTVTLPVDAIQSGEMENEPGAAQVAINTTVNLTGGGTVDILTSRTITTPAAGWVLAIAGGRMTASHVGGTNSTAQFGIDDGGIVFSSAQDVDFQIPTGAPSGTYYTPGTVHGLFSVPAGATTFNFLGRATSGSIQIADLNLSLIYIPTAYGTITGSEIMRGNDEDVELGQPLGLADLGVEQQEARRLHAERVERELSAMRARVEQIERDLAAYKVTAASDGEVR